MTTEQRRALANTTPTTEVIRDAVTYPRDRLGEPLDIDGARFDVWLEQVKRDAARSALDGLLDTWGISQTLDSDYEKGYSSGQRDGFGRIITYRDAHYPEETP